MIRSISVTNYLGYTLDMPLDDSNDTGLHIVGADGLGPSDATINVTAVGGGIGSVYNSSRFAKRTISLTVALDWAPTIEAARHNLYRYFIMGKLVRLTVVTDDRIAAIDGYVEKIDPDIFSDKEQVTVSIVCPYPWFSSLDSEDPLNQGIPFFGRTPMFEFIFESVMDTPWEASVLTRVPRAIVENPGEVETGIIARFEIYGNVSGILNLALVETNESFKIDLSKTPNKKLIDQDILEVCTISGYKYVRLWARGQAEYKKNALGSIILGKNWSAPRIFQNCLGAVVPGSSWLNLIPGENNINILVPSGYENVNLTITAPILYSGV